MNFLKPVKAIDEISEKAQKSLITPIKNRYHRCEMYWKTRIICAIIFKICVIRRAHQSFSELSNGLRRDALFVKMNEV